MQMPKDCGREDIATNDTKMGWRLLWLGLFNNPVELQQAIGKGASINNTISAALFSADRFDTDDAAAIMRMQVDHLPHHRHIGIEQIVGENHGKGFVLNEPFCAEHGMAKPECFSLTHIKTLDVVGLDGTQCIEYGFFVAHCKFCFELIGFVKVIFNGALVAAGDEDHFGDAGSDRFFDRVLDQRLVDDGQHFFRACFGGGQKTRAQSGNGENGFTDFFSHDVHRFGLSLRIAASVR